MAHLTFKHEKLKRLLAKAEQRWKISVRQLYDVDTGEGFWIVGDSGVYIMHNGEPTKTEAQHVVYAEECNPIRMHFDDWWESKRRTFGADDGADFISKEEMEKFVASGLDLRIDFTKTRMKFSLQAEVGGE